MSEARVGFIENAQIRLQRRHLQNIVAFFSPPEKPTLTERVNRSGRHIQQRDFLFDEIGEVKAIQRLLLAVFAHRVDRRLQKEMLLTPGISTGYWKAGTRLPARSSGSAPADLPLKVTSPSVTSYSSRPASVADSVLLPEPFGPMMAYFAPV